MNPLIKEKLFSEKDITRVKVRFNDTDAMGIVHFKNYLVYFDDGFVNFMNNILKPKRIEETVQEGTVFGVKKVEITYHGYSVFGDYIIVETRIKSLGKSSITFHHELYKESDNSLIATIDCIRLAMELQTNKLLNVEEFFVKYIK